MQIIHTLLSRESPFPNPLGVCLKTEGSLKGKLKTIYNHSNLSASYQSGKNYPESLLKNSECFSSALSLHCYLIWLLQHLFKQVLSGFDQ